jgi:hypothetical protein
MKHIESQKVNFICLIFSLIISLGPLNMEAQKKKKDKKKDKTETAVPTPKKDKEKTIADLTKSSKKIEGLFTIYQDTIT